MRRLDRERRRDQSRLAQKNEQLKKLRGKYQAAKLALAECRKKPASPKQLFEQIWRLAVAASRMTDDFALRPGIEVLQVVSRDLLRLAPSASSLRRGEVRSAHARAREEILGKVPSLLKADLVFREAAAIGSHTADLQEIRSELVGLLRPSVKDSELTKALEAYELPAAKSGRRSKGSRVATETDRATQLVSILDLQGKKGQPLEARDAANMLAAQRKAHRLRIRALTGRIT